MQQLPVCQQAEEALQRANELVAVDEYGKGFAHFLLALTLKPALKAKQNVEKTFVDCLKSWSAELVSLDRHQDAVWCYEQACEVWPESGSILHVTGQFLFQSGHQREAVSFLRRAARAMPHPDRLWELQNASSSLVERWHFRMLNDWKRNRGYCNALRRAIEKGHRKVLDIGSGTGLLSMLAIKSGASKVTAFEMNKTMCELSENIIKQNKMADRIDVKNMKSTDITEMSSNSDRYSLVVTEIADAGLLGEGIIPTLQHAWDHLLQQSSAGGAPNVEDSPPSQIIPAGASVFIQVVECDFVRKQHRLLNADVFNGVHVGSRSVQLNPDPTAVSDGVMEPYTSENLSQLPGGWKPLSSPHLVYEFKFCKSEIFDHDQQTDSIHSLPVICSGRADAIVSWFELHLDEETSLSSCPSSDSCWEQAVYPIDAKHLQGEHESVLDIGQGDVVDIACRCHPTWMSFVAKDVRVKDDDHSVPASETKAGNKLVFRSKYTAKDANLTREKHLNIASSKLCILNDVKYLNHLKDWLSHLIAESEQEKLCDKYSPKMGIPKSKVTILDTSGLGLSFFTLTLMTLLKNHLVGVIPCADGERLVEDILERRGKDLELFRICNPESMQDDALEDVSIILTDPVDSAGILTENALQDVFFFGMKSSNRQISVIPEALSVCAVCVESEELIRNTRLAQIDLTLGVNVELINDFKTYTQLDVFLSTLPHRKLTDCLKVIDINLSKIAKCENPMEVFTQENIVKLTAKDTGRIVAVVYWFEMTSSGTSVSTLDDDTHWRQAAFMLEEEVSIKAGDELQLTSHLRNNCLSFSVRKTELTIT